MPTTRPRSDAGPFSYVRDLGKFYANPLIRNDWLLFRNGFRKAFARLRDRCLLLAIGGVACAALVEAIAHPMPVGPFAPVGMMALCGAITQHSARSQQAWLGAHSFLAAFALDPRLARQHLWIRHALAFGALAALLLLIRPDALVGGIPAYVAAALLSERTMPRLWQSRAPTASAHRPHLHAGSLTAILLRRQTGIDRPFLWGAALLAVTSAIVAIHLALVPTAGATAATVGLVALAGIILFRLTRVDGATIRFAAGYGLRSIGIIAAHLPASLAFVATTTGLLLLFRSPAAATIPAFGLLLIWTMILRILARHIHSDTKADHVLVLLAVALALLFSFLKWLTPLPLLGFTIHLARRARRNRWTLP